MPPDAALPERSLVIDRLSEVRERIRAAGGTDVTVVGVTKAFPPQIVGLAVSAGLTMLGENYAQELLDKTAWVARRRADAHPLDASEGRLSSIEWQFIGGLQRNKVRQLAPHVACYQSVDRRPVIDEIARRAPGARLLLQVNTTGEPAKAGCAPSEAEGLCEHATQAGLVVQGLMTIGPTDQDVSPVGAFRQLRSMVDSLGLTTCSMGMTADMELAVAEGSTMIRVGRALFGPRPDGHRSR